MPPANCSYCWLHNPHIPVVRSDKRDPKGWRKVGAEKPVDVPKASKRKRRRGARVGPERRKALYERDGWKCVTCGEDDVEKLTLDHRVPQSKGGDNSDENLQTMCEDCNVRKGDRWPGPLQIALEKAGLV